MLHDPARVRVPRDLQVAEFGATWSSFLRARGASGVTETTRTAFLQRSNSAQRAGVATETRVSDASELIPSAHATRKNSIERVMTRERLVALVRARAQLDEVAGKGSYRRAEPRRDSIDSMRSSSPPPNADPNDVAPRDAIVATDR